MSSTSTTILLDKGFHSSPHRFSVCQKLPNHLQLSLDNLSARSTLGHGGRGVRIGKVMSTVHHGPQVAAYDGRLPSHEHLPLAQPDKRCWSSARGAQNGNEAYDRFSEHGHLAQHVAPPTRQVNPASRLSTRPSTPHSTHSNHPASATTPISGDAQSMALHSLEVPARISPCGGNLAYFAAHLTCLFWFESPKILEVAEKIRSGSREMSLPAMTKNAIPAPAFKKWVHTVLTTTQVTQSVTLLALMFVHRLKMTNPSVRGRPGSEYRLLTVALMLANKFLDDNTYTNKTWSEVSGISVQEIHVMEVEFLSNMRYALLATKEQWEEWLDKLGAYFEFWTRVTRPPSPPSPTLFIASPTSGMGYSPQRSPASSVQTTPNPFPPRSPRCSPTTVPPMDTNYSTNHYHPPILPVCGNGTNMSPLANRPDLGNNRKRSWDDGAIEMPAKRAYRPSAPPTGPQTTTVALTPNTKLPRDTRRLPVPNLTLNTTHNVAPICQGHHSAYPIPQVGPPPLPPLEPGMRAMSSVYTPSTSSWTPPNLAPSRSSMPPTVSHVPTLCYPPTNTSYSQPQKRLSPINTLATSNYNGSSPLHEHISNSGFVTPISHSPSVYLQQRDSPYRPIRHVHTLLNPPPPTSLHGYRLPAIGPSQMHYRPIGSRDEYRTGIVPEYQTQAAYTNSRNQGMTAVPNYQRYTNSVT